MKNLGWLIEIFEREFYHYFLCMARTSVWGCKYQQLKEILNTNENIPFLFLQYFFRKACIPMTRLSMSRFDRSKKELCRCLNLIPDPVWRSLIDNPYFIANIRNAYEPFRKKKKPSIPNQMRQNETLPAVNQGTVTTNQISVPDQQNTNNQLLPTTNTHINDDDDSQFQHDNFLFENPLVDFPGEFGLFDELGSF